ncbi:MAG TPA: HEAT repeat domain-containing protein [bacterium]|nr:HEAT repeat domain-containing protein [bacterium]
MLFTKTPVRALGGMMILTFALLQGAIAKEPPKIPDSEPEKRAWQIVDEAMADKDADKRYEIVIAASLGGPHQKVFDFLTKALEDKKVEVRTAACASLASLKNPGAIPALKKALADPVPEVFFCAAQALWMLGDPAGEQVLLEVLEKEKGTTSGFLTAHQREALATFNSKKRFLLTMFHLGIRFAPVPGLAMGYSTMTQLMADHKANGQSMAALAFAHGNDPASLQALRGALQDKSPIVRAAAVHSLALRNDPSVKEDLIPLFEDKVPRVQDMAAVAYLRLNFVEQQKQQAQAAADSTPAPTAKKKSAK